MTALWIDKYRPHTLADLTFHPGVSVLLRQMARKNDIPHLLFTGPSGGGKKTRVAALLREIFGRGVQTVRTEKKLVGAASSAAGADAASSSAASSAKGVEVTVVASNYHLEVSPADVGSKDRVVVQELLKEVASTRAVDGTTPYKVVVVHEADCLSRGAQDALRRTMERYTRTCRLILVASAACRVTPAIRSRCAIVRVPLPEQSELVDVLNRVAREERISPFPAAVAQRIATLAEGNARKALLMLEVAKVKAGAAAVALTEDTPIDRADWEEYVAQIALDVAKEQSPSKLAEVRMKVYELLTHCIPPEMIIKRLAAELMKKVDTDLQYELVTWAAFYEHRIHQGTKPVYHIEAFIARFMSLYSKYLAETLAF